MSDPVMPVLSENEPRPMRIERKAGESLRGFIVRLAENEGCNSDQMRDWLGLSRLAKRLLGPAPHAAALAQVDVDEFERMGLESSGQVWVAGCKVPSGMVVRTHMQICPACLAQDGFHRSVWEFSLLPVCPIHRIKLIDRCPAEGCGTRLSWSRWSLKRCICETDLSSVAAPENEGQCLASTLLYRRLGIPVDGPELPDDFRALSVEDLIGLMAFLGRTELVAGRGNPYGLRSRAMSNDDRSLNAGAATLLRWPDAFDELAELVKLARSAKSGSAKFGYLHRFIATSGHRSFGHILRTAYRNFLLLKQGVEPEALPAFLDLGKGDRKHLTAAEANKLLDMSPEIVARLKASPLWSGIEAKAVRRGKQKLLLRVDVEAVASRVAGLITFREADRMLGFRKGSSGRLTLLVDAGLIEAVPFCVSRETHRSSVDRSSVEALLTTIQLHVTDKRPVDPITFSEIYVRTANHYAVKAPFLILFKLLIEGKLRGFVADPNQAGVDRLVFERTDADVAIKKIVGAAQSAMIPMNSAAKLLKLRTPTIHGLIDAGLLPPAGRNGKAYLLDRAAVDGFWDQYESSGRLATRLGTKPMVVEDKLDRLGIVPVGYAAVPGRRQMPFYRNCEIDATALR